MNRYGICRTILVLLVAYAAVANAIEMGAHWLLQNREHCVELRLMAAYVTDGTCWSILRTSHQLVRLVSTFLLLVRCCERDLSYGWESGCEPYVYVQCTQGILFTRDIVADPGAGLIGWQGDSYDPQAVFAKETEYALPQFIAGQIEPTIAR